MLSKKCGNKRINNVNNSSKANNATNKTYRWAYKYHICNEKVLQKETKKGKRKTGKKHTVSFSAPLTHVLKGENRFDFFLDKALLSLDLNLQKQKTIAMHTHSIQSTNTQEHHSKTTKKQI